jgi:BirA family transcriptional regulator, biotin operon repressor / biotin---[acetyl-CoA-carboxylase] ligase
MSTPALLRMLADGAVHSGERLADSLRVSRTAVWKTIERLRGQGVPIEARRRQGYRLPAAVEFLDEGQIQRQISAQNAAALGRLSMHFDVRSTNTLLLEDPPPAAGVANACLAELQTHGRGRRGREWLHPFGGGIALSMSWHFRDMPRDLSALSLATGVAVARALRRAGAKGIALKWPNDIWFGDRKIGGVLIEMRSEAAGPAFVVIGIGLNVTTSPQSLQAATVAQACGTPPSRNAVAGLVVDEMLGMLTRFSADGFAAFREAWIQIDALRGRAVRVIVGGQESVGTAHGIDLDGGLLVDVDGSVKKFVSGEATLRLQTEKA